MRYEETRPDDFTLAKRAIPIAYLPWGAHEWHDRQNPLGLDTLKAHGMCVELCVATGGVVLPGIYCGHGTVKLQRDDDCSIEFTRECVELLATEYLEQLADAGFKVIVILMGHYGCRHMEAIREVVSDFNENRAESVAWALTDFDVIQHRDSQADDGEDIETSYMMYMSPGLVDVSHLPEGCAPDVCSRKGRDAVNALVDNAAPRILEMLDQKR